MAESSEARQGPLSRGGIAPQPLFAVGAVLLGSFLANFDSRLTSVGLPDLRGAFSLGFDGVFSAFRALSMP
jgi:DHA2 family multidrug resistance protein